MKDNVAIAEAYYQAMKARDVQALSKYLDDSVHFIGPLGEIKGKEAVVDAIGKFISFFKDLSVRSKAGTDDQAITVYDVEFPSPIGKVRTAVLMDFKEGLITRYELFFDGRSFEGK
jgi:SnoaL-like domain